MLNKALAALAAILVWVACAALVTHFVTAPHWVMFWGYPVGLLAVRVLDSIEGGKS